MARSTLLPSTLPVNLLLLLLIHPAIPANVLDSPTLPCAAAGAPAAAPASSPSTCQQRGQVPPPQRGICKGQGHLSLVQKTSRVSPLAVAQTQTGSHLLKIHEQVHVDAKAEAKAQHNSPLDDLMASMDFEDAAAAGGGGHNDSSGGNVTGGAVGDNTTTGESNASNTSMSGNSSVSTGANTSNETSTTGGTAGNNTREESNASNRSMAENSSASADDNTSNETSMTGGAAEDNTTGESDASNGSMPANSSVPMSENTSDETSTTGAPTANESGTEVDVNGSHNESDIDSNSSSEGDPSSTVNTSLAPNATTTAATTGQVEDEQEGNSSLCVTREDPRARAFGFSTAKAGTPCIFGLDDRDEGSHCILDEGRFGSLGWCFTSESRGEWGSCGEGCPLFGQAGVLGEKIDDLRREVLQVVREASSEGHGHDASPSRMRGSRAEELQPGPGPGPRR